MERRYVEYKKYSFEKYTALCIFPETYDIGVCNIGHQFIHYLLNTDNDVYADRMYFEPENELRSYEISRSINDFDFIFVSLSFETNILNYAKMMEKADFSIFADERDEDEPIIIAGGLYPTYNPEPYADYFDVIMLGDGAEILNRALPILKKKIGKKEKLNELYRIRGLYVPQLTEYFLLNDKRQISDISKLPRQAVVSDINKYPIHTFFSADDSVYQQHAFAIEIRRGCDQNCRFCVMSSVNRPARMMDLDLYRMLIKMPLQKGTEYVKLFYEGILPNEIIPYLEIAKSEGVKVRVGSQRLDTISKQVIDYVANFGQKKLTFAPETSGRMRLFLGKSSIKNEDLFQIIEYSLTKNIQDIGLYFIIGLPGEEDDDLMEISYIIDKTFQLIKENGGGNLVIGINPFFPKPKSALQDFNYVGADVAMDKLKIVVNNIQNQDAVFISNNYVNEAIMASRGNHAFYKETNQKIIFETTIGTALSAYQPILSRGDRRLGKVIWNLRNTFNSIEAWKEELDKIGETFKSFYCIEKDCTQPWDIVNSNIGNRYLDKEAKNASDFKEVVKCIGQCKECSLECFH